MRIRIILGLVLGVLAACQPNSPNPINGLSDNTHTPGAEVPASEPIAQQGVSDFIISHNQALMQAQNCDTFQWAGEGCSVVAGRLVSVQHLHLISVVRQGGRAGELRIFGRETGQWVLRQLIPINREVNSNDHFLFRDLNQDGFNDLLVEMAVSNGTAVINYKLFIFKPELNAFQDANVSLSQPQVLPNGDILELIACCACRGILKTRYRWQGDKLIKVSVDNYDLSANSQHVTWTHHAWDSTGHQTESVQSAPVAQFHEMREAFSNSGDKFWAEQMPNAEVGCQ